jgi:Fe-S oxidoreductase
LDLSPADAFFATKERLVREDRIPANVRKALDGARGFAKTGHVFPFSFYGSADTVLWPGCGLAANRPGMVRQLPNILSRHLGIKVGLILDCCFDPVYGYGDTETAHSALGAINRRLRDSGVTKVITGCLNCHKLLSRHLEGLEVTFILEALPPNLFSSFPVTDAPSVSGKGVYLHHPCPSARCEGIRDNAWELFAFLHRSGSTSGADSSSGGGNTSRQTPDNPLAEDSGPQCCGAGGGLPSSAPELADRFLDRIIASGKGRTIVTYCIGCRNRFLRRGASAIHLL